MLSDWFETTSPFDSVSWVLLAIRLVAAALMGGVITVVYLWKRKWIAESPTFPLTLVLLCVLIAMVTQVVGDHVARAFSLVGALSIVRFRTVVEDTQDIAFVIFSVVVGMAIGSGDAIVACLGSLVAIAVILSSEIWSKPLVEAASLQGTLSIRTGQSHQAALAEQAIAPYAATLTLIGAESVRGGSAFDWEYRIRWNAVEDPKRLIDSLTRIEGVQSITWKHTNGK